MFNLTDTLIFINLLIFAKCSAFNTTTYRQMPPLHNLEDYDACLDVSFPSKYCVVYSRIVPNDTSPLWNQIEKFSRDSQRHYQHQDLFFGVCLNRCKKLVATFDTLVKRNHYRGRVNNSLINNFLLDMFKRKTDSRIIDNPMINQCINYDFKKKYNLLLSSNIAYCVANDDQITIDSWDIAFITIVSVVVFLTIASSTYEYITHKQFTRTVNDSVIIKYEKETPSPILTSFSIFKNWKKLTDLTPRNQLFGQELQFLHCFRFITTIIVIFAHTVLAFFMIPLKNPDFLEMNMHRFEMVFLKNGTIVIQIFFVISGFLFCIKIYEYILENPKVSKISMFSRYILVRYLRIVPAYGFVILFYASFFDRIQNGPLWRLASEGDRVMCREESWKNLLFVNNISQQRSCMHHTWYLATDFQLLIFGIIILLPIAKFPKLKKIILSFCLVIAFLVPFYVTYKNNLDAWFQFTPEGYRFTFFYDPTYNQSYIPSYTNLGGYLFGIITGYIFTNCFNTNFKLNENKIFLIMWYCSVPIGLLVMMCGHFFISNDISKPSLLMALYSAAFRFVWGVIFCVIILGMYYKISPIIYKFCTHKIFLPLGRLGYCTFLVHVIAIKVTIGYCRDPLYINTLIILNTFLISALLSLFLGLLLTLFIEMPMSALLYEFIKCDSDKNNEKNQKPETETIDE